MFEGCSAPNTEHYSRQSNLRTARYADVRPKMKSNASVYKFLFYGLVVLYIGLVVGLIL